MSLEFEFRRVSVHKTVLLTQLAKFGRSNFSRWIVLTKTNDGSGHMDRQEFFEQQNRARIGYNGTL